MEALRRAIIDGTDDAAPAAEICKAVVGGESAEDYIEQLVDAYRAVLSTTARTSLGLAITVDLLRRGAAARWIAVRGRDRHELDAALLEADKIVDVRDAIYALASNAYATSTIGIWWRRDRSNRMADLVANISDEALLHVAGEVGIYEPRAPLVPRLAEILTRSTDAWARSRAAFQLLCAANLRCDLGVAREALRAALDDDRSYGNPAADAARALTVMGETGLDRDPRAAVRMGASRARANFLGLLDPEPTNRIRIASDLLEKIAKDAALCPSPDELQCLLAELLDPVVAEVVYAVIDRGNVAAVIAKLEPRGMTRHLVAAAQATLAHAPPPLCRTCRAIPRHVSETDDEPKGLTGSGCAECGTAYEYDSYNMDDIYGSIRRTYDRVPAEDPADVARWRDRLDHPELWARRDAAWIVARHAVAKHDQPTIDMLVTHPDVEVRREAWRVMPTETMRRALDDTDDQIRSNAASQLARGDDSTVLADLIGRDAEVAFVATVNMNWNKEYPDNVVQALHARVLAARGQTQPDRALETACRVLGGSLGKRPDQRIVDDAIKITLQASPAIQSCLLQMLAGCGATADTSALDDTLVALLQNPDTCVAAAELLRARAQAQQAMRADHLQALPRMPSDAQHIALSILAEAALAEPTRSVAFTALLALVHEQDTMVAPRIHELAQKIPLGDAVPRILALAGQVAAYARQELVRALLVDAKRRGDTAFVDSLRDHPNPAIARDARYE